jgi:starch phosphorylase
MTSSKRPTRPKPSAERAIVASRTLSVETLTDLALDLHWAWNHSTDELWSRLEPDLWAATHNPCVVLQTVSKAKLDAFVRVPSNQKRIEMLLEQRRQHATETAWFQEKHPDAKLSSVAYFSMEYALSEALPVYSGGLGNVAGDQLKAACDLDVPVIGIGILYQQGYFRQMIRSDGSQEALYPFNDPGQLPITPVRDPSGELLRVRLSLPGYTLRLRAWQVRVDRRTLYLLDSNDPANPPAARAIASELYGGGPELRLQQEMMLGIGGWRLLRALGLEADVCHLNEGHAALAVLERARSFAEDNDCSFGTALTATRAGNVFTTHTPVSAGFDRFAPALVERYLRRYAEVELGIAFADLLAMGRERRDDPGEAFNMTYLAIRASGAMNGVSRLHGAVSRRLFTPLFPRWPESEVPVGHVTNGVHAPTWDSAAADALWTKACGPARWRGSLEVIGPQVRQVTDTDLWSLRTANRAELIAYLRERLATDNAATGVPSDASLTRQSLDPHALTLCFARRFATYKRPTLLLHSEERLLRILVHSGRPVQLIIAGKAHPADEAGQSMIREWVQFSQRPEVDGRVVFVADYDLLLAERLVQGVDLWINTPRRPWEASGTSGMKILVNGGLNLSELDGWWAEAYAPDVGWALGDGREHGDDSALDAAEADALYALLEREIVPAFYSRDATGIPSGWVSRMRESMATLAPRFSTNRVVREYTEHYYLPAAAAYRERAADKGNRARQLLAWQQHIAEHWHDARFGAVSVETRDDEHAFTAEVYLGGLSDEAVRVELFADSVIGGEPQRHAMARGRQVGDLGVGGSQYTVSVPASRPADDYTPRLVPFHASAKTPLEVPNILWQR